MTTIKTADYPPPSSILSTGYYLLGYGWMMRMFPSKVWFVARWMSGSDSRSPVEWVIGPR